MFYKVQHPGLLDSSIKDRAILPFFVMQQMPVGVSGLVIAGIFAAAMSTIDNGMNAISLVFTTDFYRRLNGGKSEKHYLNVARVATLGAGVIATVIAVVVGGMKVDSLLKFFYRIMNLFGGSLAGLFVLGIFTRRANGRGALAGALASMAAVCVVKYGTDLHYMLHAGVGLVVCVGVGYVVSLLAPSRGEDAEGLTVYTMPKADETAGE